MYCTDDGTDDDVSDISMTMVIITSSATILVLIVAQFTVVNSIQVSSLSRALSSSLPPPINNFRWPANTAIKLSLENSEDEDVDDEYYFQDETTIDVGSRSVERSLNRKEEQQEKQQRRSSRSILVIDDEASIRTAVGEYLTDVPGYTVTTFSNARDALDYLDSIPLDELVRGGDGAGYGAGPGGDGGNGARRRLPNAIVSDILMPGEMDGLQFLSALRGTGPGASSTDRTGTAAEKYDGDRRRRQRYYLSVPVVLLTAKGMTKDRIRGYDAGADGYLPKPFDPEELVGMLESVIAREEFLRGAARGEDVALGGVTQVEDSISKGRDGGRADEKESARSIVSSNPPTTTETIQEYTGIVLSMDELDVLELLCQGKMNKEMAVELTYSVRWVEGRLTSMFRKTNCTNRTELVRWAVTMGYVDVFK